MNTFFYIKKENLNLVSLEEKKYGLTRGRLRRETGRRVLRGGGSFSYFSCFLDGLFLWTPICWFSLDVESLCELRTCSFSSDVGFLKPHSFSFFSEVGFL